jgi:hypothetical protein
MLSTVARAQLLIAFILCCRELRNCCAAATNTICSDRLGLWHVCQTFSIMDEERARPRMPPKDRQRSIKYSLLPSAIKPELTVLQVSCCICLVLLTVLCAFCTQTQLCRKRAFCRCADSVFAAYSVNPCIFVHVLRSCSHWFHSSVHATLLSAMQILQLHQAEYSLVYRTAAEGGIDAQSLANAVLDTGLSEDQVLSWLRSQRWSRQYQRRPQQLPPQTIHADPRQLAADQRAAARKARAEKGKLKKAAAAAAAAAAGAVQAAGQQRSKKRKASKQPQVEEQRQPQAQQELDQQQQQQHITPRQQHLKAARAVGAVAGDAVAASVGDGGANVVANRAAAGGAGIKGSAVDGGGDGGACGGGADAFGAVQQAAAADAAACGGQPVSAQRPVSESERTQRLRARRKAASAAAAVYGKGHAS